jgi:hypothetical protein
MLETKPFELRGATYGLHTHAATSTEDDLETYPSGYGCCACEG